MSVDLRLGEFWMCVMLPWRGFADRQYRTEINAPSGLRK